MRKRYRAYVVSHTHWDREWFKPFQGFRKHLVDVIDELMEVLENDPSYHCFTLDGQTAPLDDYLEIRPEQRERLAGHVRAGEIEVGPWFVSPDEFLVSGESLVRNLLRGFRGARAYGVEPMKVGHAPDNFGHVSQLPQIFAGFGIDSATLFRGLASSLTRQEFRWDAPDGTGVLGVLMESEWAYSSLWYALRDVCEGAVPYEREDVVRRIAALRDKHAARANTDLLLFMDGVDHSPVWRDLGRALSDANAGIPGFEVRQSRLADFIADLRGAVAGKELQRRVGELRQTSREGMNTVFMGTMTSHVRIKQANAACEKLLTLFCEPVAVAASLLGKAYPTGYLNLAWRYLLLNHPHDSICGCSVDQVHRDMVYRFDQARLIGEIQLQERLDYLATRVRYTDEDNLEGAPEGCVGYLLFNPDTRPSARVVRLSLLLEDGWQPGHFVLRTPDGRAARVQVLEKHPGGGFHKEHNAVPIYRGGTRVDAVVDLPEPIPALGYCTLIAEKSPTRIDLSGSLAAGQAAAQPRSTRRTAANCAMENEHLRVQIAPNGTLALLHKATGYRAEGLLAFEDVGDLGDGWNFVPARHGAVYSSVGLPASIRRVADGPLAAQVEIEQRMEVPAAASPDNEHRTAEGGINTIRTRLTLMAGCPYLLAETTVENNTRDHGIRVVFPTGLAGTRVSAADTAFDVVERDIQLPDTSGWPEPAYSSWPRQSLVDVSDGAKGLAVLSEGLYQYDIQDDACRTLSLLLVRGFRNVVARPGDPDAQSLGTHRFRYAICPHAGDWQSANLPALAQAFRLEAMVTRTRTVWRGVALPQPERTLPPAQSFLSLAPEVLILSALKKAEDRDSVILRFYNPSDRAVDAEVRFFAPLQEAYLANLDEQRLSPLSADGGVLRVPAGPRTIVTLELVAG